jgi:hypothetical protein
MSSSPSIPFTPATLSSFGPNPLTSMDSPMDIQYGLLSSSPSDPFVDKPSETPFRLHSERPVLISGSAGRNRVGLGVAMSTAMSCERENEWTENIDLPLSVTATYFSRKCVICFLAQNPEYEYHRSENCPSKKLHKQNNYFYSFRVGFDVPAKMCYGCGLHTGVCLVLPFFYSC